MHVVITGANRGIGAGLHQAFADRGDTVTGTARASAGYARLDVTDPQDHRTFAQDLDGRAVDLLVCNAGVYPDKGLQLSQGYTAEVWAQAFRTNVTGVFLTIETLLPNLQAAKTPKVAIISSLMGSQTRAPGGSYAYRATKAAVLNLGRNLAQDLKPIGIAIGIYHPGWVRTDMGGENADIDLDSSVAGLVNEFDRLSLETTGCFRGWNGQELPL